MSESNDNLNDAEASQPIDQRVASDLQSDAKPQAGADAAPESSAPWRRRLHEIIFEADTRAGKVCDVGWLRVILISVAVVMLQSVNDFNDQWGGQLEAIEWVITGLFTLEYILRLLCVRKPRQYATSFFGVIDLLAILPTYVELLMPGSSAFSVVRVFRLIRVFRIFKLSQYVTEANVLLKALKTAQPKIVVFLLVVMTLIMVLGTTVYVLENRNEASTEFTSIPQSIYWAIVTVTTVGYGDMAPQTVMGQTLAAISMILGYAIIIVPSGIFSVEIIMAAKGENLTTQSCPECIREGHDADAKYCKYCGAKL